MTKAELIAYSPWAQTRRCGPFDLALEAARQRLQLQGMYSVRG